MLDLGKTALTIAALPADSATSYWESGVSPDAEAAASPKPPIDVVAIWNRSPLPFDVLKSATLRTNLADRRHNVTFDKIDEREDPLRSLYLESGSSNDARARQQWLC